MEKAFKYVMCGLFDIEIFFYVLFTNSGATYFLCFELSFIFGLFWPKKFTRHHQTEHFICLIEGYH